MNHLLAVGGPGLLPLDPNASSCLTRPLRPLMSQEPIVRGYTAGTTVMVGLHIRATALRTCSSPPTTSTPTYPMPSICCARLGKATRIYLVLWERWPASLPAVIGHGSLIVHRRQFQIYLLASLADTVVQRCSLQRSRHASVCTGPLPEGSHGQGLRISQFLFLDVRVLIRPVRKYSSRTRPCFDSA
jgi:hypothetical protein